MEKGNVWFVDTQTPGITYSYRVLSIIKREQTPFQFVEILNTQPFGKVLAINGRIQSAEKDEFIYHEALVLPALAVHPNPRFALVIGGGEGATLREILKRPSIQRAHMIDIDRRVVELCREYLPEWSQGAFDDPRVEVFYEDAFKKLKDLEVKYDLIFIDLTEPGEEDVSKALYSEEFYSLVKSRLSEDGIVVVQAGCADYTDIDLHRHIVGELKKLFKEVWPYYTFIPSFMAIWGFAFASDIYKPADLKEEEVDQLLKKGGVSLERLKFYSPRIHRALFAYPLWYKELMGL